MVLERALDNTYYENAKREMQVSRFLRPSRNRASFIYLSDEKIAKKPPLLPSFLVLSSSFLIPSSLHRNCPTVLFCLIKSELLWES